jgi:hypothetical protein
MNEDHKTAWSPPSEADLSALTPLGRCLEKNRARATAWKWTFFAFLALLALANFEFRPHEPHFGLDALPLFWPAFGLVAGVVMVFILKKILQPWFLKRPEDYYGDL